MANEFGCHGEGAYINYRLIMAMQENCKFY